MLIKENRLLSVSNSDIVNETFIIPKDIDVIEINAFTECFNLKRIVIPKNVLEIGKHCFSKCQNLEFVKIEANIKRLPNEVFSECPSLREVHLPETIKFLGNSAFKNCFHLSHIDLPNGLEIIEDDCFYNCASLSKILLPSSLIHIGNNSFTNTGITSIMIPNKIIKLNDGIFKNCKNLMDIVLSDNLISIGNNTFDGCMSLKNIKLPKHLAEIGSATFSNCINIENIILPSNVEYINTSTFSNCSSLKYINILGIIKGIDSFAFSNCQKLKYVYMKNGIKYINHRAFQNCKSIKSILLPSSIKQISENAFDGCEDLGSIVLPSSLIPVTNFLSHIMQCNNIKVYLYDRYYTNSDYIDVKKIRICEMIDKLYDVLKKNNHIYNLTKEKIQEMYQINLEFKDILDTMIFNSRMETSNYEYELSKFNNLFVRTRFSNLPSGIIYNCLDDNLIYKYNVKMYRKIKKLDIFNSINLNCEDIVADVINFFGLFENDGKNYQRFEILKKLLQYKYTFTKKEYFNMPNDIKKNFINVPSKCFLLETGKNIPSDFKCYLKNIMYEEDIKNIKKLSGRFGKIINDFFRNNYSVVNNDVYVLNNNIPNGEIKKVNQYILNSNLNNQITYSILYEIFYTVPRKYNLDILDFFVKNINIIISKNEYRLKFKEIVERYEEIKHYYLAMGNANFSYNDAYRYLCESVFLNVNKGNKEFEQMVKKAGVTSQGKFEKYQQLYEGIKYKKNSIIPRINESIEVEIDSKKYTLLCEMLRKDDPFALLVGELSYTNCCQQINDNGYDCLVHSINDGRVFCTYLINETDKILLSESWVWRNGNVICFDNIEGTNFMKKNILYSKLVAKCYKFISDEIVEMAKRKKDKIDVIMIGKGHNDLKVLSEYFGEDKRNKVWPPNYYSYLDSSRVYYACGNEELIDINYKNKVLYTDERIFVYEMGVNITTKTIQKLGNINNQYSNINFAYELSNLFGIALNQMSIIYGEDWYILYSAIDENLNILDSGILTLNTKKALIIQEEEILKAYKIILNTYNVAPDIINLIKDKQKKLYL